MPTELQTTGGLQRKITLPVSMAEVGQQVERRLRDLSRTVRMPGFRPGKVPIKLIQQSYGQQVQAEVLGDTVSKAFSDAVAEHKLRVAGQPNIEPRAGADGGVDGFTATFEVYPDVSLGEPATLAIERAVCPVGDADVDRTIDVLRKQRTTWSPAGRAAADGDRLTIDFVGRRDGAAFEGGSGTGFTFVLGEGRMLPDFETGLRGAAVGERRSFPVAFPADYGAAELAGKTAEFEATVNAVDAPQLPALDEAFARQLGVADGSLEALRADVRRNLEREVSQRLRARTKGAVMDALPQLASIELPGALVQAEAAGLAERARADLAQRGMDVKNVPIGPDAFTESAARRVRLGLIVAEIVRANALQARPDQIRKQIEEFAATYENPGEVLRWYFSDKQRLAEVEALVVEQNVVDWALSKAQVTERTLGFDELMGNNG
jgi:trigger factor